MSSSDETARRGPDVILTLAVYLAIVAAILPLLRVVALGFWTVGAIILPAAILAAGYVARRFRLPAVAVSLIEAAVWLVLVTLTFLRDDSFLGVLPMPSSIDAVRGLLDKAVVEIVNGSAPLTAGESLSFLIIAAIGLLTIAIDHVVLTARMPLLGAVGILAVSLIPAFAVPRDPDVVSFVFLAAALLFLLRAETRGREASPDRRLWSARRGPRNGGVAAAATGIGAVAVIVALVAAPLIPATARSGSAIGGEWNAIDPSLQLGKDLRRPEDRVVLRYRTNGAAAPYLRAATLSEFTGAVWSPDTGRSVTLANEDALGPLGIDDDIRLTEATVTVEVDNLLGGWLPVPYPAVKVEGLEGSWGALPYNRTVLSTDSSATGQTYSVVFATPRPTLEQIRATDAGGVLRESVLELPGVVPMNVRNLAHEVTDGFNTDYDKLAALQRWFRGTEFEYSLEAPVEQGFDGTGVDAIYRFLQVRSGYCIHFASAFALMARTLDMPARIVVGFLPGDASSTQVPGETVYVVSMSQLHAWPEVYFRGIGWIPFEPTKSLGTPTGFSPTSVVEAQEDAAGATPTPTSTSSARPSFELDEELADGESGLGSSNDFTRPLPWLGTILAIILALMIPAGIQMLRRRELFKAASTGDAAAAWRCLQDTAIDLAIALPVGESPRGFAARLVAECNAPPDAMHTLVGAIEKVSYSAFAVRRDLRDLTEPLAAVRSAMIESADRPRRLMAILAPRSLVVRPGSMYAGGPVTAPIGPTRR